MHSQDAMQSFQEREQRARERNMQREAFASQARQQQRERAARGESLSGGYMTQEQAHQRARAIRRQSRVRTPLTSQESHDQTQMSREAYEQARARRDVLSPEASRRTSNREIIDGRGSIDSRAFNERNELVGYTIDENDRHEPAIDTSNPSARWNSHAGQGFGANDRRGRMADLGSLSDTISGRSDYKGAKGGLAEVPGSIKFLVVLIVVLLAVLIYLLFF